MILNIILLSLSTAIWGFGFIATRWTFQVFDPFWSNALRFALAGLLSIPFLIYKKSFWRKKNILKKAMISSIFLLGTLLFQTLGLTTTTVAKSGFITTLYSLFIPLTMMALTGKKYRATFWSLVIMALVGMALMCNLEVKDLNQGDFLTLLCAICAAFHIMYIGKVASQISSPVEFNFLQNFFVAIFSVLIALIFKGPVDLSPLADFHSEAVRGLLFHNSSGGTKENSGPYCRTNLFNGIAICSTFWLFYFQRTFESPESLGGQYDNVVGNTCASIWKRSDYSGTSSKRAVGE
jgi:drug/metabolite transporter (DMT)-like permease